MIVFSNCKIDIHFPHVSVLGVYIKETRERVSLGH